MKAETNSAEARLKTLAKQQDDAVQDEVLRTKTISMKGVRQNYVDWIEPFLDEYENSKKTVIEPLSREDAQELTQTAERVQRVPGKLVATVKPPMKRRGRLVACGLWKLGRTNSQ